MNTQLPTLRVLLVEDELHTSELMLLLLEMELFIEVDHAPTLRRAGQLLELRGGEYDIAIFDNVLPDGQTVAGTIQRFKGLNPLSPMLMTSGSHPDEQLKAGGPEFSYSLSKPFNKDQFLTTFREMAARRREILKPVEFANASVAA